MAKNTHGETLALGLAVLTLGSVMAAQATASAPAAGPVLTAACAVAAPSDPATPAAIYNAVVTTSGGAAAAVNADKPAAPLAVITVSGSNLDTALPAPCPTATPPAHGEQKITKSRSNIQNN